MALKKKRKLKDGTLIASIEGQEGGIPLMMLADENGDPYTAGGSGGGGTSFDGQLKQGGSNVSTTNPLPTKDVLLNDAIVNNGTDVTGGAQMMMAGGVSHLGTSTFIPVGLEGVTAHTGLLPIGGVDESGNQKMLEFNEDRVKVELNNENGPLHQGNPLPVFTTNSQTVDEWTDYGGKGIVAFGVSPTGKQTAFRTNADSEQIIANNSLGAPTDVVATTDTGTWSMPSLLKKLNQSLTSLLSRIPSLSSGRMPVETKEFYSESGAQITPSDTANYPPFKSIYVGVGGDVSLRIGGVDLVFKNVQAGTFLPGGATRVNSTNTVATNILIFY